MTVILFLIIVILFIAFIVGMIKPSILRLNSRGKVTLFTLIPSIVIFIALGVYSKKQNTDALNNPKEATELSFYDKNLTATPEILKDFTNLKKLNLESNKFQNLDSNIILNLINLEELNISDNPVSEFPNWIVKLKKLKSINISGTKIEKINEDILSKINVNFDNTPYEETLNKKVVTLSEKKDSLESESFSDFAIRNLLGKEYGDVLKINKCEMYYIKPVTKDQAQKLGDYLKSIGFFKEDNEVAVQVKYNSKDKNYEVKFVVDKDKLTDEIRNGFKMIGTLTSISVFENATVKVHLCDVRLKTFEVL